MKYTGPLLLENLQKTTKIRFKPFTLKSVLPFISS